MCTGCIAAAVSSMDAAQLTSSLRSNQLVLVHCSSISCTVAPAKEGKAGGVGVDFQPSMKTPHPPFPASQTPPASGPQAVCLCVYVCPAIFGPVVQRPLYLRSELSSITRPAPVTQSLLNGPASNDTHTHTHKRYRGQRHCGACPERRHNDIHVNKQEVTAQSPLG